MKNPIQFTTGKDYEKNNILVMKNTIDGTIKLWRVESIEGTEIEDGVLITIADANGNLADGYMNIHNQYINNKTEVIVGVIFNLALDRKQIDDDAIVTVEPKVIIANEVMEPEHPGDENAFSVYISRFACMADFSDQAVAMAYASALRDTMYVESMSILEAFMRNAIKYDAGIHGIKTLTDNSANISTAETLDDFIMASFNEFKPDRGFMRHLCPVVMESGGNPALGFYYTSPEVKRRKEVVYRPDGSAILKTIQEPDGDCTHFVTDATSD